MTDDKIKNREYLEARGYGRDFYGNYKLIIGPKDNDVDVVRQEEWFNVPFEQLKQTVDAHQIKAYGAKADLLRKRGWVRDIEMTKYTKGDKVLTNHQVEDLTWTEIRAGCDQGVIDCHN